MSALAALTLRTAGAPELLVAYAEHVQELAIGPDAKRLRRNAAKRLLDIHPDLDAWMGRATSARLADLRRSGAWCFLSWCFLEGRLRPDLDLLVAKTPGDIYAGWAERHPRTSSACRRSPKGSAGARTGGAISSPGWRWSAFGLPSRSTV